MTTEELRDLTRRTLTELDLNHGWSADGWLIVVEGEGDQALFITFREVEDTAGAVSPVLTLESTVLEDVAGAYLPPALLGELNDDLIAVKVVLTNDRLAVRQDVLGWPGSELFKALLEIVLNHRDQLTRRLDGVVDGSSPRNYSEIAADAIARAEAS
jgi:hypothetical protein